MYIKIKRSIPQNGFDNLEIGTIGIRFHVWDAVKGLGKDQELAKGFLHWGTNAIFHHITTKTNKNIWQTLGLQESFKEKHVLFSNIYNRKYTLVAFCLF